MSSATTGMSTALFEEGTVSGSGGCNDYTAAYTTEGDVIGIGPVAATKRACEGELMEQERWYFGSLEKAATYKVSREGLELRDEGGSLQVKYGIGQK